MIDWNNVKHVSEGMATKGQSPSSINWDKVEYIPNKIAAKNAQIKTAQTANFEERFAPKLDTKAIDMFATPKPKPESKNLLQMSQGAQQAMANAVPRTPIDQRLNLFPGNEKADDRKYIGANLIPAYKEDKPLAKVGKGIVNYGVGGALSLLGNVGGAPQQAMMQTSRAGTNLVLGKPQQTTEMSFGKDLLGAKEENIGTMALAQALDPATYIGGGIVDDLSRAGFMGKASKPSTEMVQVLGDAQQKVLAKMRAKVPLTQTEIEVVNNTPEFKQLLEAKSNVGYHFGDLGKADSLNIMPGRDTGHFGTGTYFFGNENAPGFKDYAAKGRPMHSVDFDGYRLYKPQNKADGLELHGFLKDLNDASLSAETNGIIDDILSGKVDDTYIENVAFERYPWTKEMEMRTNADINTTELEGLDPIEMLKAINRKMSDVKIPESITERRQNIETLTQNTKRIVEKIDASKSYMMDRLGLSDSEASKVIKEIVEYGNNGMASKSKIDSPSTVFMKKMGYDGIDVRGIDGLDNSAYGSVIYDVNSPLGGKLPKAEPKPIGGELPKADAPQGRVYGDTPKGDIPVGQKERGISHNVRTDTAMPDDMRTSFDERPLGYDPDTNPDTLKKAQTIFSQGEAAATSEFYKGINDGIPEPEMVPLAKMLARQMSEAGNTEGGRQVLSDLAVKMTEAGQFSQAAKILREADPETFLMTMDKQIRKLNEQGLKQYGKKWANVDLLPDEITAIQGIQRGNQQAYEEVWEQIGSRIATHLPSTKMEKFDAWRRMAMLLNPKTHIRNLGGNVIMMGMRKSGDTVGAAFEKAFGVKTGNRTKSFGWSLNKKVASKVDETWDVVKKDILGESRWEIDNLRVLGREKNTFKKGLPTKAVETITGHEFDRGALQWVNDLSLKTLNVEDNIFTQRAFKDALGQFMQANKLDEATDAAITYAKRRAMESTYKQANKLATWINQAKQIKGAGKLVEAAIPFSKTPANIMKTAFEYSPAGLTKLIFSKGKTSAEVIETLSKGLTGTAISGLGFALASMGAAKTQNSASNKKTAIDAEMGEQAYSITTPQGSYTFDWAQPFAVPLAMGIAMYEGINNKDELDFDAIMDSIAQGGDSFFNMSMLQNVKRFLGYGSTTENVMGLPWNYVQQAWPSLFGQAAKTIDDTKRSAYDPNPTKQTWNQLKSRIPFASKSLEPSLNVWGEEQKQGGIIQQFVNPGYAKKASDDPVTKEVARLHGEFGNNDMLPKMAQNFTIGGKPTKLSPEDMTQFQRDMGQMNYREIKELINSPKYSSMTDEEKMKKIKKIVGDNYDEVKEGIIQRNGLKPSK